MYSCKLSDIGSDSLDRSNKEERNEYDRKNKKSMVSKNIIP